MNRIKQLRNEKNINQDVLAKLLGLEVAGISKLETERVPLKDEYIIKLSDYFGVSTDYLLCKSNIRNLEANDTRTPIIRKIERGAKKLNDKDQEKAYNMLKIAFEEAFSEDSDDT